MNTDANYNINPLHHMYNLIEGQEKSDLPYYLKIIRESVEILKEESYMLNKRPSKIELEEQIKNSQEEEEYEKIRNEVMSDIRQRRDKIIYKQQIRRSRRTAVKGFNEPAIGDSFMSLIKAYRIVKMGREPKVENYIE